MCYHGDECIHWYRNKVREKLRKQKLLEQQKKETPCVEQKKVCVSL